MRSSTSLIEIRDHTWLASICTKSLQKQPGGIGFDIHCLLQIIVPKEVYKSGSYWRSYFYSDVCGTQCFSLSLFKYLFTTSRTFLRAAAERNEIKVLFPLSKLYPNLNVPVSFYARSISTHFLRHKINYFWYLILYFRSLCRLVTAISFSNLLWYCRSSSNHFLANKSYVATYLLKLLQSIAYWQINVGV